MLKKKKEQSKNKRESWLTNKLSKKRFKKLRSKQLERRKMKSTSSRETTKR